jgi:hypothetical protein
MRFVTRTLTTLIAVTGCALLPNAAYAQSCRSLVQDHINWLRAGGNNRVEMTLASTRANNAVNRTNFVSYASGDMRAVGLAVPAGAPPPSDPEFLTADVSQAFSDRPHYHSRLSRVLPFDPAREDRLRVSIQPDGRVHIVLLSWGDGTITFNAQCLNGIIMGANPGGDNPRGEIYLISLSKQSARR